MAKYSLSEKILDFLPYLNERQKRIYLASESKQLGHGGIGIVSDISGINRNTITRGKVELEKGNSAEDSEAIDTTRIRRPGAGRKSIEVTQPGIYNSLEKLVDTGSVGPLRWTTKSLRRLSSELSDEGYKVCHNKVGEMLESLGYNLQLNQKMCQDGDKNPDKDKQFEHINETCKEFNETNDPVISVFCKKRISSDTAEFAVASIRSWWMSMGKERYPDSKRIYITADAGSENNLNFALFCSDNLATEATDFF